MATASNPSNTEDRLVGGRSLPHETRGKEEGCGRKTWQGKEKAKLCLTWRKKSEILRTIFEVGYASGFLRSTPRSNPYVISLS